MAELKVDKKTIIELFSSKDAYFLIPDYQRPYAWDETHCETLWNDLKEFTLPDNNADNFNKDDEYFLGPIVTCRNDGKKEVIDGQQRITTLLLLLRSFYEKFKTRGEKEPKAVAAGIRKSIWENLEFDEVNYERLKIDSQVATDTEKDELIEILKKGETTPGQKSRYAKNFNYFKMIDEFSRQSPTNVYYFANRVLNNCILLPIEAESQDTALRIFSTLNDRGLPLSDSDLFKAKLYKFFGEIGTKDYFIAAWKELEKICQETFITSSTAKSRSPVDDLFYNFMFYDRVLKNNRDSTLESLRKYYEKDNYQLLRSEENFKLFQDLAYFWYDVQRQNGNRFSPETLKRLFILNYAPNNMWMYFVSVYYFTQRDSQDTLEEAQFCEFLDKLTIFTMAYHIIKPGTTALRTPYFQEMVKLAKNQPITFGDYKFKKDVLKELLDNYTFTHNKPITKSLLVWWAFQRQNQEVPSLSEAFDVEHIYSRRRQQSEPSDVSDVLLESIGNKSILEKSINVRASDYKFIDKKKYYQGLRGTRNRNKKPTMINDLLELCKNKNDFTGADIKERQETILGAFIDNLEKHGLIQ